MRSGAFGTGVCQPARAATRYGPTSFLAGLKRNTQPHGVGYADLITAQSPPHEAALRRIGITKRSAC